MIHNWLLRRPSTTVTLTISITSTAVYSQVGSRIPRSLQVTPWTSVEFSITRAFILTVRWGWAFQRIH